MERGIRQGRSLLAGLVAVLGLLTSGCAYGGPAPVQYASGHIPYSVTVKKGDTLWGLAREHKVSVATIASKNNLKKPYRLRVGQQLRLPVPAYHRVAPGDTLYGIARRYGVGQKDIASLNDLANPGALRVGQDLRIPKGRAAPARGAAPVRYASAPAPRWKPTRGGASRVAVGGPEYPVPRADPRDKRQAAPGEYKVAARGFGTIPVRMKPKSRGVRKSPFALSWPVNGKVVSGFGKKGGGLQNDGINIAVPVGTPVRAAQSGIVVYHGNELRAFGNLVLIKHTNGLVTAYAHNSMLKVRKGDRVKKGEIIALSGASGGVTSPQVHFQVRQGTRVRDPQLFLEG